MGGTDGGVGWHLTGEESLHVVTVGHLEEATARVSGQGGVSSIGQQDAHHVQMVVLYCIMNGSGQRRAGCYIPADL